MTNLRKLEINCRVTEKVDCEGNVEITINANLIDESGNENGN